MMKSIIKERNTLSQSNTVQRYSFEPKIRKKSESKMKNLDAEKEDIERIEPFDISIIYRDTTNFIEKIETYGITENVLNQISS